MTCSCPAFLNMQELLEQLGRKGLATVYADAVACNGGSGQDEAAPLQPPSTRFLLLARRHLKAARKRSRR